MFIKLDKYTINTDNINYAEKFVNGVTVIYFNGNGPSIQISDDEANKLWAILEPVDIETQDQGTLKHNKTLIFIDKQAK